MRCSFTIGALLHDCVRHTYLDDAASGIWGLQTCRDVLRAFVVENVVIRFDPACLEERDGVNVVDSIVVRRLRLWSCGCHSVAAVDTKDDDEYEDNRHGLKTSGSARIDEAHKRRVTRYK